MNILPNSISKPTWVSVSVRKLRIPERLWPVLLSETTALLPEPELLTAAVCGEGVAIAFVAGVVAAGPVAITAGLPALIASCGGGTLTVPVPVAAVAAAGNTAIVALEGSSAVEAATGTFS